MGNHRPTPGIQNRQTFDSCNQFAPKGHIRLSDFYQMWHWERVPDLLPHAKFHRSHFTIVAPLTQ